MNFQLAEQIQGFLNLKRIEDAIILAEEKLSKIPETPFHFVIGKEIKTETGKALEFITAFYDSAKAAFLRPSNGDPVRRINPETFEEEIVALPTGTSQRKVNTLYVEMNGFTINHDLWYADAFAYSQTGELDNLDWLADYEFDTDACLPIIGYEQLQTAYSIYMQNEQWAHDNLRAAAEICELLIILRLQQFFIHVYSVAKLGKLEWAQLPLLVTAHEYDVICDCSL